LTEELQAKVAQLVEHDLAKVGVASSNLVFRSNPSFQVQISARMVELVDTQDLKSCDLCGRVGSSPTSSTDEKKANQTHGSGFFVRNISFQARLGKKCEAQK
jgi:hypothetical protein